MLELIRKYRTQFSIIFVVASISMVIGMFSGPSRRSGGGAWLASGVVAKVDGEEIQTMELAQLLQRRTEEAERTIQAQLQKTGNTPEARQFLESYVKAQVTPERVLQSLIENRFYLSTADRLGIVAPPEAVRARIQQMPNFRNKNGQFDPLLYKQSVARPAEFEEQLAQETRAEALRTVFIDGLGVASKAELAELERFTQGKVFEALTLSPREFPEPAAVSPAQVDAFLKDAAAKATLQAYYDRHVSEFRRDEQIRARHILVPELKQAQEVLAEIQSGKLSFEAAAKKYSTDKSNSGQGGDLNYFGRGVMDPAFEAAAFGLKNNNDLTREPVKSSFGYHLIQLVDRRAPMNKTLDSVTAEIAPKALLEKMRADAALAWMKGWLSAGREPTAADLKRFKLSWKKLSAWTPMDEKVGNLVSADAQLGALASAGKAKPLIPAPFNEGDQLVALKWVSDETPKLPEGMDLAAAAETSKLQDAFQFYLTKRYESLEKDKKIVRSESTLAQFRTPAR